MTIVPTIFTHIPTLHAAFGLHSQWDSAHDYEEQGLGITCGRVPALSLPIACHSMTLAEHCYVPAEQVLLAAFVL